MNNIIYQCKESNDYDNTSLITILIEKALGFSHLFFSTFFDAIEFVFEASINKEICLVIDKYPYILGQIDCCDSKLQALIDKYKEISKLKLILIGSISIMEEVLEHNSHYIEDLIYLFYWIIMILQSFIHRFHLMIK